MTRPVAVAVAMGAWLCSTTLPGGHETVELTRQIVEAERTAILARNLALTDDEAGAFWPIYERYRAALGGIENRRIEWVDVYVRNEKLQYYHVLALLDELVAVEKDEHDVKRKYSKKIRKVLPPRKALLFFQIESRLDAVVRHESTARLPLENWRD